MLKHQCIYRSIEEFSEALKVISAEEKAAKESTSTFGPKIGTAPSTSDRKQERSIYTWLRNRTSGLDFGKEITDADGTHPIHLNTNKEVLGFFDDLRHGHRSWLDRLRNEDFVAHRAKRTTLYLAGNSRSDSAETLVMIDIDCKKTGSLEGALAFADFLKEHFFPGLYIEVSTHGKGAHGYFVLSKYDYGAPFVNDLLLHRLQPWLRKIMREQKFDVENVEIKGTLPDVSWGTEKYEVLSYKAGTLAKFPRMEAPEDEDKLRKTTDVDIHDLLKLPTIEDGKDGDGGKKASSLPESISGKHISESEIGEIDGHYRMVAESLMEVHALKTKGKTVATVEDLAIFLMLLKFFTQNMNLDGSLPVKRWKEMWRAVFESGDVDRCFCPQRFSTIRNHLSKLGLLEWKDENYQIGWVDDNGHYHKGKACKWKASDELMSLLELPVVTDADTGVAATNKEKEGGASFIRTNLLDFFRSIIPLSEEETIRPVLFDPDVLLMLNPDEINRFIEPFDAFTGLAA